MQESKGNPVFHTQGMKHSLACVKFIESSRLSVIVGNTNRGNTPNGGGNGNY